MQNGFEYHQVKSLDQALTILDKHKGAVKIIGGGTDLLLEMHRGKIYPQHVISLQRIEAAQEIQCDGNYYYIGPNTTHRQIEKSKVIQEKLTALYEGSKEVGSVQIRNTATVMGNICNAVPSADTAAPLLALKSKVRIHSSENAPKELPLTEFFVGPGKSVLKSNELVSQIIIPVPSGNFGSCYIKLARRKAMELALIGAAAMVKICEKKKVLEEVQIALNTSAPTPIRVFDAEAEIVGQALSEALIKKAGQAAQGECSPRTSWRCTAEYRRELIKNMVIDALTQAILRAGFEF